MKLEIAVSKYTYESLKFLFAFTFPRRTKRAIRIITNKTNVKQACEKQY